MTDEAASATEVLAALAAYRSSERAMRVRTGKSMRMGATDLKALRFVLREAGEGKLVTSRRLADHLEMTSAAVTAMVDRLVAGSHLQRHNHPSDRRSIVITATPGSDEDVRQTLGEMHLRLMEVAGTRSAAEAGVVHDFLTRVTAVVNSIDRVAESY